HYILALSLHLSLSFILLYILLRGTTTSMTQGDDTLTS
ncbi:hypothetical protein M2444_006182, partial [Paenibacillus sp. PastF-3]|nr:hypothetical protein [Paenibacillus sp. PastF-3]